MEQRDFFISYTNADEAWAVWIANVLKSNGYTAYVQALDIKPGDNFVEKMNEFLKHSRNFIAVWSEAYPQSRFCMAELQSAFYAWNKETMAFLLPVRIDNHPLEPLYAGLVYIDLADREEEAEMKLMDAVRDAVPRLVEPPQKDAEIPYQRGEDYYQHGEDYLYGRSGVAKNYIKAREYYERAAIMTGHAEALHSLGWLYEHGYGVEPNYARARNYYEQAAAKGSVTAAYNLGKLCEYSKDYASALRYYQIAANAGSPFAPAKAEKLRAKLFS